MADRIVDLKQLTRQAKAQALSAKDAVLQRPAGAQAVLAAASTNAPPLRCRWGELAELIRWLEKLSNLDLVLVREHQTGGAVSFLTITGTLRPEEVKREITGEFLVQMQDDGVPEAIVRALEPLRGQVFKGSFGGAEFADAVKELISTTGWREFGAAIERRALSLNEARKWRYMEPAAVTQDQWPSVHQSMEDSNGERGSRVPEDVVAFRRNARNHLALMRVVLAQVIPEWWVLAERQVERMEQWVDGWRKEPETSRWALRPDAPPSRGDTLALSSVGLDDDIHRQLKTLLNVGRPCPFKPMSVHFHTEVPHDPGAGLEVLAQANELDAVVNALRTLGADAINPLRLRIAGHTDQRQSPEANLALSNRRVQWLLRQLRERLSSFPFAEVEAIGLGEAQASGPADNPADRRCDIVVEAITRPDAPSRP